MKQLNLNIPTAAYGQICQNLNINGLTQYRKQNKNEGKREKCLPMRETTKLREQTIQQSKHSNWFNKKTEMGEINYGTKFVETINEKQKEKYRRGKKIKPTCWNNGVGKSQRRTQINKDSEQCNNQNQKKKKKEISNQTKTGWMENKNKVNDRAEDNIDLCKNWD